jgi:hypothetical protein
MYYRFQCNIYLILLRHVSAVYGHHQVCVSSVKIVSLCAPFYDTFIFVVNLLNYLYTEIIKSSIKYIL